VATTFAERLRPEAGTDYRTPSRARNIGRTVGVVAPKMPA